MGLLDRLKATLTPTPAPDDGEDDLFTDVDDDPVNASEDGDDNAADNKEQV